MVEFHVTSDKVEEVRSWFMNRGGVFLWKNKEIGSSRPDVITPKMDENGNLCKPPHWAYQGEPIEITSTDLRILHRTIVHPPNNWFPVCEHCHGSRIRTLQDLADARGETVATLRKRIEVNQLPVMGYSPDSDTVGCSWCQGTGHTDRALHVAIRRKYWGVDVSKTGRFRADRYAKKLGKDVQWDFEPIGSGRAVLFFYKDQLEPFVL